METRLLAQEGEETSALSPLACPYEHHQGQVIAAQDVAAGGTDVELASHGTPAAAALQEAGTDRALQRTDTATFDAFVRVTVSDKVSLLTTDEHSGYRFLKDVYPHQFVRHGSGQYVVGAVHTNTIEGYWSIFKRGVVGTCHKVSRKCLPLYIAEFQFRYDNRGNKDIFGTAVGRA